jgi:tRNA (Thr-GGU) A37 N-methylase
MLDKTPLLDIKPYVPQFDPKGRLRIGWLKGKIP